MNPFFAFGVKECPSRFHFVFIKSCFQFGFNSVREIFDIFSIGYGGVGYVEVKRSNALGRWEVQGVGEAREALKALGRRRLAGGRTSWRARGGSAQRNRR